MNKVKEILKKIYNIIKKNKILIYYHNKNYKKILELNFSYLDILKDKNIKKFKEVKNFLISIFNNFSKKF